MRAHEVMDADPCRPQALHAARDQALFKQCLDLASARDLPIHYLQRPMRLWIRAVAARKLSLSPAASPSKNAIGSGKRPQLPDAQLMGATAVVDAHPCSPQAVRVAREHASLKKTSGSR